MLQCSLNSYIVFLIVAGRLADIFGKKTIYLVGIGLFLLASLIIVTAPNIIVLIAGRALQGVGFALGSYMTVAGLAQALGPSVGGIILQFLNWRWIFSINLPLSALALVFVTLLCPKGKAAASGESIDFNGTILLGTGLILLALGLNEIGQWGVNAVLCVVAGFMVLVVFYRQSKRVRHPLINFSLFKNRVYSLTNIIRALHMYDQFAMLLISAFVLLGIGAPIIASTTPALSLSALPEKDRGAGMGAFYMFAFIGSLAGVALASSALAFLSDQHFQNLVSAQHLPTQLVNSSDLLRALHGASSVQSLGDAGLIAAIKSSFVYGLKAVMWINAGLVLIALCLCRWLTVIPSFVNQSHKPCKK